MLKNKRVFSAGDFIFFVCTCYYLIIACKKCDHEYIIYRLRMDTKRKSIASSKFLRNVCIE